MKVQRKVRNGVAGLAAARSSLDQHRIAAIPAISAIEQRHPCRDPGIRPELRISHAAAQTRIVSVAGIRPDSRKSVRSFKGIIGAVRYKPNALSPAGIRRERAACIRPTSKLSRSRRVYRRHRRCRPRSSWRVACDGDGPVAFRLAGPDVYIEPQQALLLEKSKAGGGGIRTDAGSFG